MITQKILKELLDYNPLTGVFTWRRPASRRMHIGDIAGTAGHRGWQITVGGKIYGGHRLAWLYVHGDMPEEIDHRDLNPLNNRIGNLRPATRSQNAANTRTRRVGLKGAYWHKGAGKWMAAIRYNYTQKYLGLFNTEIDAHQAYNIAAISLFGEFARSK